MTARTISAQRIPAGGIVLAGLAAFGMMLATPAMARDVVINVGKDRDLLEQLIELDREDIDELRAEFAEARADIAEAIGDITEAREDVKNVPGANIVVKIAFATARASISAAASEALGEVRTEIDKAEVALKAADVSDEERVETQDAINVLRTELDALETALGDLRDALRA